MPSEIDAGGVLDEVFAEEVQFNQVSPPVEPEVLFALAPTPRAPIE
jgi:hypothetical protein